MVASKKAMEIVGKVRPDHRTAQIWRVWEDVSLFRQNLLSYRQIAEILKTEYRIEVDARQLITICSILRKRARNSSVPAAIVEGQEKPEKSEAATIWEKVQSKMADPERSIFERVRNE